MICVWKKENFLSLVEKQIGSSNDFLGGSNVHFPLFRDIFSLIFATVFTSLPVTCFQKKLLLSKEKKRRRRLCFYIFLKSKVNKLVIHAFGNVCHFIIRSTAQCIHTTLVLRFKMTCLMGWIDNFVRVTLQISDNEHR